MLLRTRISLIMLLFFTLAVAGLAVASLERERVQRTQHEQALVAEREALWHKILLAHIARMEDKVWMLHQDPGVLAALRQRDPVALAIAAAQATDLIQHEKVAERVEVIGATPELFYSSQSSAFPSPVMSPSRIRAMLNDGRRRRGVGNDTARNVVAAVTFPLRAPDDRVMAVGTFASNITGALTELKNTTGGEAYLVNRRGRMLAGTNADLWQQINVTGAINQASAQTVWLGDKVYSKVSVPMTAEVGNLIGAIVTLKDVTETHLAETRVALIGLVSVGGFLLLTVCGLYWYLRHTFAPLTAAVGVLNALSRGETKVRVTGIGRRDEIGFIAEAVDVFRLNMVTLTRMRRSQERQRQRQERFIRREMTELANTLDEDARREVLAELEEIEHAALNPAEEDARATQAAKEVAGSGQGLAMMALAFEKMSERVQEQQSRLSELVSELREALKSKTQLAAMQQELEIATRVQKSILPGPPAERHELSLFGLMRPAREVGGDFYDYFYLDDHRLGLIVADVSGKGVPAALFMAISQSLLRATAQHIHQPGRALAALNDLLAENNQEEMFVTLFYGVLDLNTGTFRYANAGHNPPLRVGTTGTEPLPRTGGVALACLPGLDYDETGIVLHPGDGLLLYTDGVSEAMDPDNNEYGEPRLMDRLNRLANQPPEDVLGALLSDIDGFADGAPQADDITCVYLRYYGPQ
jgi:phosphoserine phosphatase RsbU/P